MLGAMIEQALKAEQKAEEIISQARETAAERERRFDAETLLILRSTEEQAVNLLHKELEDARTENELRLNAELQKIRTESENFLEKHENLISEAAMGVCDILSDSPCRTQEK